MKAARYRIAALGLLILFWHASVNAQSEQWRFKVFLDDQEIGYHHFTLSTAESQKVLRSEARFNIKFLIFNAYTYRHDNTEIWEDGCLIRISALTDDNKKRYVVTGNRGEDQFVIQTDEFNHQLPECVKTFAYWDPDFLKSPSLLNSQTGEYLKVQVRDQGEEVIQVRGKSIPSRSYRLVAEKMQIDLWYSQDQQWVALESLTEKGRKLIYKIQ